MKFIRIFSSVVFALLGGCSSAPTYRNASGVAVPDAAIILSTYQGVTGSRFEVRVSEVDGVLARKELLRLAPGKREIAITVGEERQRNSATNAYIEVDLGAGRQYYFRAVLIGISYHVDLVERDGAQERVVKKFKILRAA